MTHELLDKFPNSSAFDFNYSQSSIWSPLLPRSTSHSSVLSLKLISSRKLLSINSKGMFRKQKQLSCFPTRKLDFSFHSTPQRGWRRVLKTAMKRFKFQGKSSFQRIKLP